MSTYILDIQDEHRPQGHRVGTGGSGDAAPHELDKAKLRTPHTVLKL